MEKKKVSKTKIISLLRQVAAASFTITRGYSEIKVNFRIPFYKTNYIWDDTGAKWIAPDGNLNWGHDRKNVLALNSVIDDIFTKEEESLFENCGFKVTDGNIIFTSDLVKSINIGTEENFKEIFFAARKRVEKEAAKINDPSKFHFKKKKVGTKYRIEAFVQKNNRPTLSTLILEDYEINFIQEAVRLFKNKKTTNTKVVDFFVGYGFEVCKNVRASIDYGYSNYTYFYAKYKLTLPDLVGNHPDQPVLDFKKLLPILTEAYRIHMRPWTGLYFDNQSSAGWAIYSITGGYNYVG